MTTSGAPIASRFATTGIEMTCSAVYDHSAVTVRFVNVGWYSHVSGSGCGKHLSSVGSQKLPGSQSYGSVHTAPGTVHAFDKHTAPALQQTSSIAPQRTPDAHAVKHRSSTHSLPAEQ